MKVFQVPMFQTHSLAVKRIKFNSKMSENDNNEFVFASGGKDYTVRIFKLKMN